MGRHLSLGESGVSTEAKGEGAGGKEVCPLKVGYCNFTVQSTFYH